MFRIYLYVLLATAFTAGAVAETHTIVVGGSTDTFEVAPGDTVIFEVGCVSLLWSGHPCSPDGVFFGGSFPPHCAPIEWVVPQFASAELPFSSTGPNSECDILWSGLISVVGDGTVINVPHDHTTIQSAIDFASDGDTIVIAAGTYYEHDLTVQGKGITIRGEVNAQGNSVVTIDAQQQGRVLKVDPGDANHLTVISNLILTGGLADGDGGGLQSLGSAGFVRNCTFVDNQATGFGGGMSMEFSGLTLGACHVTGNTAAYVGGVHGSASSPTLSNCVINENMATMGSIGGVGLSNCGGGGEGGPPTCWMQLDRSIVCGNWPEQSGGLINEFDTCISDWCGDDADGDGMPDVCYGDADGILNVPDEYPTIQDAIDLALDGQVVMIAAGTYVFSGDIDGPEPGAAFYVYGKSITISGARNADGSPAVTILGDENDPPYGVEIYASAGEENPVIIEHLKITGCIFGLLLDQGTHTVNNCIFENNLLAGLYIADAQVAVSDSLIHDGGTGIWLTEINADVSLVNCLIDGNTVQDECPDDCPGDIDGDQDVDIDDFSAFLVQFGQTGADLEADIDGDQDVDIDDFSAFLVNFGNDCNAPLRAAPVKSKRKQKQTH